MTVDEHDMDARVQVGRTHNGNSWVDLCWRELPDRAGAKRENWMADRAKNAMGTAKLASVYLDQERGRIGRLRKTKSVLASGKFNGKNLNKRRHRPHPTKPKHPQNQCHRKWREVYGQTLPDSNLPSVPSKSLSHTNGNASASRLLTVSVAKRSSRENHMDNGTPTNNHVLHGESTAPSSASDVRDGANPSLALQTKGDQLRSNPPCISIKVDSHTPYVPGDLFDHNVHHRSKNSLSQPRSSPSRFGPSAIDLFDQCKLLPELAVGLKEKEDKPQPPKCRDTNACGSGDAGSGKASAAAMDWPASTASTASTASAVTSLPLPDCASSDSPGTPCHETRACKTTTQNRISSTLEPPTIAEGGSPAYSLVIQHQGSPEKWKGVEERIQRGESKTAENGVLSPRRLNPVSAKAKMPAKSERAQYRGNTSPASPPISLATATATQNDGGDTKGTSSQQRLVDALAQLQKNKDLDALRSEYVEALSILQKITHPFSATSRTTIDEESQKVNDVGVQVTRVREKNRKKSEFATETSDSDGDSKVDTYDSPDSKSAAMPGVEVVPADEGMEALSANLPRIDSREQNALRLLYRKWWTQIATGGSVSCLPVPSNFSVDEGPTRPVSQNRRTELIDEGGSMMKKDAKMGTEAFVGEEIRRNRVQDASKRKDVAIATEVELPGSIDDATTRFSSLRMLQPLKGKMGEERRISSAPETRRSSDVGRRPQVKNECTGYAIYVTPLSPRAVTSGIMDGAGHTSHHRNSARARSLVSAAGLTQNEKTRLSHTRTRQTSIGLPMAGEEHYLECPSNKTDQASGDARQGNEEEKTVQRCCQDITPVTRKDNAVITKAKSLGSLENMTRSPSESLGIQLASVGAGPERRRERARAIRSSPNIGCNTQGASEGTETMNLTTPKPSRTCTCDVSHDAGLSSCGRAKENCLSIYSAETLVWKKASGYEGNTPNEVSSEAIRSEDSLATQLFFKGSTKGPMRKDVAACLSLPLITLGATHDVHHTSCFRTKSRARDYKLTANFAQQHPPGYEGNQPDQMLSYTSTCRKYDEEQAVPRCSVDVTKALTREDVAITTDTGGRFASFEEQIISAGVGTDERRRSGVSARGGSLNVGGPRQVASRETEVSTPETLMCLSPPIIPRGVPHNAHQTRHGRSGARTIESSFARDFALREPYGYTGNQFNQNMSKSSRGEAEEQAVSRCFQDITSAITRKYVAVASDTESPGNLGTIGNNTSASLRVKLNTVGPRVDEQRRSVVKSSGKSLDVGGVAIEHAEAVTADIMVSLSPSITTLDATHDAHQTNRGRARVAAISSSSAVALMLHEPSGYTENGPNQALINAIRMNEERQGEPRRSQDVTQAFTQKDVAVGTEIESPGNFGDVTSSTPTFLRVQLTSVGVETEEERSSGKGLTWSSLDFGGSPQVARGDPEATVSRLLVTLSPPTINSAGYTIENSDDASPSRTRSRAPDSGSAVEIVEHKPSENPRNQCNQEPNDVNRGNEQEEEVPRRSRNVTTAPKLDNSAFVIEANSPGSLSDMNKSPSTFLGVQFISRGVGTDERRCISVTSTECNSDVDGRPQVMRRDTEDAKSVTLSYISSPTSTRDDKGSEEDEHTVQRSSDEAATVPERNDNAVTTKTESVGSRRDKLGNSSALELQLSSLGEGTDEICCKRSRVQGSSLDVGGCPEVTSKNSEATVSVILVSPHTSTLGTTDGPQNTTCGHTTAKTLVGLSVDYAPYVPLGYSSNQSNQASCYASLTKEEEEVAPSCSQDITIALTRNYLGFVAEVESPGSLGDVTGSSSASPGVQLTSVGVNTDDYRCSSSAVATSVTMVTPPIITHGDTHDTHDTTYDRMRGRHVSLDSAVDLTPGSHTGCDRRRRARALSLDSAAGVEQHELLAYTGKRPNRVLSGVQQWKGGEQAVQRCLQYVSTVPTRIDVATSTKENLGNNMRSPSTSLRIQPTSAGQGTDERRRSEVGSKGRSLDVGVHPSNTCENIEAMISYTPVSPPSSTRDVMIDATITSCGRSIASAISSYSAVSFAQHKPLRYTENPPNQASRDSRRGTEGKETVPKCSKEVTAANKQRDGAAGIEAESPGSLGGVVGSCSASLGVQLTLVEVNTDEHRRSSSAVAASLTMVAPFIIIRGDTQDTHYTTYGGTNVRHVSLDSEADLTQDCHTGRGRRRRARALSLDSAAGVEQHEPLAYTGKRPNRALSGVQQWEGGEQAGQRCLQDVFTVPTRIDVATSTKENLGNIMRSPSASPRIQPTPAGQGVDEKRRSEVSSKESSLGVDVHPLSTCENIEAITSSTPVSPPTSTRDVMVDATITSCGCSIASSISLDSAVGFARRKPSRYTDNPPNRTSRDSRRGTEGKETVQNCSMGVTVANKQRDEAVGTEAESPGSLGDVTGSSSASPGVQLTSVGVNTDEHRRSGSAVAASLTMVAPSIATRGDTHDARYTTDDRTKARHVSLGSAADLTPDSYTVRGHRRRARALSLDSAAGVEQHEPLAYTGKKPNRALSGVQQWEGEEQAVQRCLQDVSTVPTRTDVATSTKENLGNIIRSPSTSPRIQPTSAAQGVDERRRSEVSSKGKSLDVEVHPFSTCENIEAMISFTPVPPPTNTRDVIVDATITSCGRSIASAVSPDSAVSCARHKPSRYTGNPPNQVSRGSRRGAEGEEAVPKCSKEVTAANKQRDVAVGTEVESPESLSDVTGSSSASLGVQLTSRVETGEIRRSGTEAETPLTLSSSSTTTRSATLDAHHTIPDRTRARVASFGSATELTREDHISHCHRTRAEALSLDSAACATLDGYLEYTDKPNQTLIDARRWKKEEQTALRFYHGRTTAPTLKDIAVETETKAPSDNLSNISGDSSLQLISVKTWVDKKKRSGVRVTGDSSNICRSPRVESGDAEAATCMPLVYHSPPNIFSSATHEADQTSHGRKRARATDSDLPVDFVQRESLRRIGYQADPASSDSRWHDDVPAVPRCSHNATTATARKDVVVMTKSVLPGSPGDIKLDLSTSSGVQLTLLGVGTNESRRNDLSATGSSSDLSGRLQNISEGIEATVSVIPVSQPISTRNTTAESEHTSLGCTSASAVNFVPAADSVRQNPLRSTNVSSEHALNDAIRGKEEGRAVPRRFQDSTTINSRRDIAGATEAKSSGSLGGVMRDRSVFPGEQLTCVEVGTDGRRRSDMGTTGRRSDVDNHPRDVRGGTQDATDDPDLTSGGCKRARDFNCDSIADLTEYEPLGYTDIQPNQTLRYASREKYVEHTTPRWPQSTIAATTRKDIAATTETEYLGRFGGNAGSEFVSHTVQLTLEGLETGKPRSGDAAVSISSVTPVSPPIIAHGAIHDAHSSICDRTRASTLNVGSAVALVRDDHTYHCCSTQGEPSSLDSAIGVIRKGSSRYTDNKSNQTSNDTRRWKEGKKAVQIFSQDSTPAPTWKEFDTETKTESPGSLDDVSERPSACSVVQLTSVGLGMDEISRSGARVTRGISPVGRLAHLATEGTGVVTSDTLAYDSPVMNRSASQDGHYNNRDQKKACAITRDLRTGSEQNNPSRYRCNQLIQTSDARRGKDQGHIVSWLSKDITTVHQQRVIMIATGEEPSGSLDDIEDNFSASFGAKLSSVGIETGETWRGDVRALGRSSIAGWRSQGTGESTALADSGTMQLPSITIHDASCDAHHTSVSRTRVSARSHSCDARVAGRRSGSDRHPQGMIEGISVTLSPPPAITYNATNDIYETSCGFRETSVRGRGLPASVGEKKYFERYTGNRPIQVLSDFRQEKQDTSTGTTRRGIAITTQTEPPKDIGDVLREGSPSLGVHLSSTEIGTDKRRRSATMATERSLSVRRRPRVVIGDAEAETSMNLTYLSPPIITRDAINDVHHNSHSRKRARDANFDPVVTPYKPSGYTESRPNNDFSNTRRGEQGKQGVRRYSQDITAATTRKYVSIAGKTESPRKLRAAISVSPISSPTRTCKATIHADYTNHSRPAKKGHASGTTMGLGEGEHCELSDDQTSNGASDEFYEKHGVAKVDVDEDYVSEEDCLVTGEEEEGIYGRIYLPDGRFTTLLGLDPDRNREDEDEIPTEDGILSEFSWQETAKWSYGEDAKSLEYDDDDFEEL